MAPVSVLSALLGVVACHEGRMPEKIRGKTLSLETSESAKAQSAAYKKFLEERELVPVRDYAPNVDVSLAYATTNNITGRKLYESPTRCLLDQPTAKKLAKAQTYLEKRGKKLRIWDAYRPTKVQLALWRAADGSEYVADPRLWWSKHCSGRAVDVTLVDLETGAELVMPTKFDDFSKAASSNYKGRNKEIRENLVLLKRAMTQAGFRGIEMEWWHFANSDFYNRNIPPL